MHSILMSAISPREFEEKAKREVSDEKLKESTIIVTSIEDCIKPIEEYFNAGFQREFTCKVPVLMNWNLLKEVSQKGTSLF